MKGRLILSIVLALGAAAVLFTMFSGVDKETPSNAIDKGMQKGFTTQDDLIQFLASEAVLDASARNGITLDYSVNSLQQVEKILGGYHDQFVRDQASLPFNNLASAYGAYIGEVIRRSEPSARWSKDHPVGGNDSYPLRWSAGDSFPFAWASRRIANGSQDDIWYKYQFLKNHHTKGITVVRSTPAPSPT